MWRGIAAAAAAKSLQSCPTLCDPIDGSPPGSPVPGILQARTLEWVAISFSNGWKWKVKEKPLSHVRLLATPWTAAYQAPPSLGFSRQEWGAIAFSGCGINKVLKGFVWNYNLFSKMRDIGYVYVLYNFSLGWKGTMILWGLQRIKSGVAQSTVGEMRKYFICKRVNISWGWEGNSRKLKWLCLMVFTSLWYGKRDASQRMQKGELNIWASK